MDRLRKSSKTMRRALAALLAFAMSLSPVAVPATSDAAAKKPALNAKKKTLFFNQAGKKSFTLKIKKNKNIKVKKTTWKTTNKKVASISSKKKTAVKVTAKKAGKATIKATVNYTLKGSKKVKKTTLKCKVTSKSYTAPVQTVVPSAAPSASASAPAATATATATASAAPTNKPTTEPTAVPTVEPTNKPTTEPTAVPTVEPTSEPTAEPTTAPTSEPTTEPTAAPTTAPTSEPTAAPTAAPTEAPVAETISVETAIATIGVAKDINTVTLSATVKDQNGAAMSDAVITWSSDKADIASVDKNGVVTGLKEGKAVITATCGKLKAVCNVTVDATAPEVKNITVSSSNTISVELSEAVSADKAIVNVYKDASKDALTTTGATLSEDEKTLIITNTSSLAAGTYKIVLKGLADIAGNVIKEDTTVSVEKAKSYVAKFVQETMEAPADVNVLKVYYTVVDQYGEEMTSAAVGDNNEIKAAATISGTEYPLTANVTNDGDLKGYVSFEADGAIKEGKSIDITLTNVNTKDEKTTVVAGPDKFTVKVVKTEGVNKAIKFGSTEDIVTAEDTNKTSVKNTFVLDPDGTNEITVAPKYLDKFGYSVTADVEAKYVVSDENVLKAKDLVDGKKEGAATFKLLKAGTANITIYMTADETQSVTIPITVKPAKLQTITAATMAEAVNGEAAKAEITLNPATTGLTASDLKYVVTEGADAVDSIKIAYGTEKADKDKIFVTASAKKNAKDNTIKFVVYYGEWDAAKKTVKDGGVASDAITFTSKPSTTVKSINIKEYAENKLTAGGSAQKTTYTVTNKYGEDITASTTVSASSSNEKVATVEAGAKKGELNVTGVGEGKATITVSVAGQETKAGTLNVSVAAKACLNTLTLAETEKTIINNDDVNAVTYIAVSAKDQYANDFALTKNAFDASVKVTAPEGLTVSYYNYDAKTKKYTEATDSSVVTHIGFAASYNADKLPAKAVEVKFEKQNDAKFADVKAAITVNADRKVSSITVGTEAQTALVGVATAANKITVKDQYDTVKEGAALEYVVLGSDGKATKDAEVNFNAYDPASKTYSVDVTAEKAGTYSVIVYVNDNTGSEATNGYDAKDTQAKAFTVTAGEPSDMIASIKLVKAVKGDYIKLDAKDTPTTIPVDYKAFDKAGNEIKLGTTLSGMVLNASTSSKDLKIKVVDAKQLEVTATADNVTSKIDLTLDYTANDSVKDATLSLPVSNTASAAKEDTYKIYKKAEYDAAKDNADKLAKLVEVKDASLSIAVGDNAFVVVAKDQYGEDATVNTAKFYSVVSTNESFATVACENEVITVTRKEGTAGSAKATIKVEYSRGNAVNFEVKGIADKKIELTSANCSYQGYGGTAGTVTVADGKATVTLAGYSQGIKVSVKLDENTSITDYSAIKFDIQAINEKIGMDTGENNKFVFEMQNKTAEWLQGPGASDNVRLGSYAFPKDGEVSVSSAKTITIPIDGKTKDSIKATTGDISFVLGITGKNEGAYTISNISLVG